MAAPKHTCGRSARSRTLTVGCPACEAARPAKAAPTPPLVVDPTVEPTSTAPGPVESANAPTVPVTGRCDRCRQPAELVHTRVKRTPTVEGNYCGHCREVLAAAYGIVEG